MTKLDITTPSLRRRSFWHMHFCKKLHRHALTKSTCRIIPMFAGGFFCMKSPSKTENPAAPPRTRGYYSSSFASSRAIASWSGHEVPLPPQSVPFKRRITSSTCMPSARRAIPCVFPLQPRVKRIFFTIPSSSSKSIFAEQTPCGVYVNCAISTNLSSAICNHAANASQSHIRAFLKPTTSIPFLLRYVKSVSC